MSKQFTTCPQCGAMGEIGANCEFCGAHIEAKDNSTVCNELIPQHRTISSAEFAKKVSIFHNVGNFKEGLAVARIGQLNGVINLNGDLVLPLEYNDIHISSDGSRRMLLIDGYKGQHEIYLVLLNDNQKMLSLPSEVAATNHMLETIDYSFMHNYKNSILITNCIGERYTYLNYISKTYFRFNKLIEDGHYCYVLPSEAKNNKEYLMEAGFYDTKTWSLVKKLDIEDKRIGQFYLSTSEPLDRFIAEGERLARFDVEFEEHWKKKERDNKVGLLLLFGIPVILILLFLMWL